jgi:transcription antitermination factor NusA-like protein
MEDPSKFFNVVIDKTNQKLNSFQAQIIVLESQLQMAADERDAYKNLTEKLSGQNYNIEEVNKFKDSYVLLQEQLLILQQENVSLKTQLQALVDGADGSIKFIRDQNETLLQEIKRLNAEVASLSVGK